MSSQDAIITGSINGRMISIIGDKVVIDGRRYSLEERSGFRIFLQSLVGMISWFGLGLFFGYLIWS